MTAATTAAQPPSQPTVGTEPFDVQRERRCLLSGMIVLNSR
jgi:hypothetical protein